MSILRTNPLETCRLIENLMNDIQRSQYIDLKLLTAANTLVAEITLQEERPQSDLMHALYFLRLGREFEDQVDLFRSSAVQILRAFLSTQRFKMSS